MKKSSGLLLELEEEVYIDTTPEELARAVLQQVKVVGKK